MYDEEFALKIIEKVNKEKQCLISDNSDLIARVNTLKYYYSNEQEKEKHSKIMINQGYTLLDKQKECLYYNFNLSKNKNLYVIVGIYTKQNYYIPFIS